MTRMRFAAVAACAVLLAASALPSTALAADMMSGDAMADDAMMGGDEAMAAECMMKAEMETDEAKMTMMVEECHEMYPDVVMESDAM